MWAKYFGLPKKEIARDPYLSLGRENYDLPEAYFGSNLYLDLLIIYQIRLSQMYAITRLLPLKRWDKSISISWDIWKFDAGRLGRTPEESMSRLLTSTFDTGSASFHRWGLAFMLEHGFMNTPRGRLNYRYNLVQIANATIETLCYGVVVALLSCSPMSFLSSQAMTSISNDQQRWALFQEEIDQWAVVHKRENPLMDLWNKLNRKIQSHTGEEADVFFVPYGTRGRVHRPEEAYYFLSGKTNDYNRGTQMPGVTVFESRDYKVGEGKDEDPAWQERTIGQHAYMLDKHLQGVKLCDFRTDMMDTMLFNEKNDVFSRISYKEALQTTGLFHHNRQTDTWDFTDLGMAFFEENTTVGDYLASVGKLDTWAKQLTECDHQRLLNFIRKFSGIDPEEDSGLGLGGSQGKFKAGPERGPFHESAADKRDHQGAGAALGNRLRNEDPELSVAGVELMKKLFELVQAQPAINVEEEEDEQPAAVPAEPAAAPKAKARTKVDPKNVYKDAVATLKKRLEKKTQANPNLLWACVWATHQLGQTLQDYADWEEVSNHVAPLVKRMTEGLDNGSVQKQFRQYVARIFAAMAGGESGGSEWTYVLCINKSAGDVDIGPNDRFPTKAAVKNLFPYREYKGDSAEIHLLNLFNATTDYAKSNGDDQVGLNTAATAVEKNLAAVKKLAKTIADAGSDTLQPAASAFARLIANMTETKATDIAGVCRKFTDPSNNKSCYAVAIQDLEAQYTRLDQANALQGRFHADQVAEEEERDEADKEPVVDMRDVAKHVDVYKRTPAIRTMIGDKNMFLLYHRMVLAQPRAAASADDDEKEHQTISSKQFIYYLSLIEQMYAADLEEAKTKAKDRKQHERNAELRVIYILQESAFQRMFKLRKFLEISQHPTQWDGGLSVQSFIAQVSDGTFGFNLKKKIRTSQNALLQALKAFSEDFIKEWHKKLPKTILKELETLGVERIVRQGGSSVAALQNALDSIKKAPKQLDPTEQMIMRSVMGGGGGGSKDVGVSPDYIKEMLRNMPLVDGEWVRWGLENNMWPVIGIFLLKPYGTWVMGQAFAMQGGGKVGYTFEGHHDFQLQDNAIRKMHVGHWTLYAKPIVIRAEGVAHGFNIVANGYVGGNDDDMWDIQNASHIADYQEGKYLERSIFPVPVRINRSIPHWVYDITNSFNRYLGNTPETCKEPSLALWSAAWGWLQDSSNPLTRPIIPHDDTAQLNTIVFQANQYLYDHHTGRLDFYVRGRGHWGDREVLECFIRCLTSVFLFSTMAVVKCAVARLATSALFVTERPRWPLSPK